MCDVRTRGDVLFVATAYGLPCALPARYVATVAGEGQVHDVELCAEHAGLARLPRGAQQGGNEALGLQVVRMSDHPDWRAARALEVLVDRMAYA